MKNITKLLVMVGFCCVVLSALGDIPKQNSNLPIIKVAGSPFKICLQPKNSADTSAQDWLVQDGGAVTNGYVTADQANTLQTQSVCFDQTLTVGEFKSLTDFEKDIFTAVAIWQSYIKTTTPIQIDFFADDTKQRFSGSPIGGATIPHAVPINGSLQKFTEVQPQALTVATTSGSTASAVPVMQVRIAQAYGLKVKCFDSTPTIPGVTHCSLNQNKRDVTSSITHELGHGFGIISLRSRIVGQSFGTFPNNHLSTFDFHTNNFSGLESNSSGGSKYSYEFAQPYQSYYADNEHFLLFTGPYTQNYLAAVGYALPQDKSGIPNVRGIPIFNVNSNEKISGSNFSHFGVRYTDAAHNVVNDDLMSLWANWDPSNESTLGQRLNVTTLDLKVLEDMGYPLQSDVTRKEPRDIFEQVDQATN